MSRAPGRPVGEPGIPGRRDLRWNGPPQAMPLPGRSLPRVGRSRCLRWYPRSRERTGPREATTTFSRRAARDAAGHGLRRLVWPQQSCPLRRPPASPRAYRPAPRAWWSRLDRPSTRWAALEQTRWPGCERRDGCRTRRRNRGRVPGSGWRRTVRQRSR